MFVSARLYSPASDLMVLLRARGRQALITASGVEALTLMARSVRQGTVIYV